MATPLLRAVSTIGDGARDFDALVLIARLPLTDAALGLALGGALTEAVATTLAADDALSRAGTVAALPVAAAPGGRLVLASLGALADETDDVRSIAELTSAAVSRAVDAGARAVLLAVAAPSGGAFALALEVASLAALATAWQPLEAREAGRAPAGAKVIGVLGLSEERARYLSAVEAGRSLARDVTGTEPERMAPLAIAALCEEAFAHTGVKVEVERDVTAYPLLAAVARASLRIERHRPAVVTLDWRPEGPISRTLILCGKGVTYDTGGADLKTDGHMAGMSRDKGGAGSVAGFVRTAAELRVPGVRVVGLLGLVRNSIGDDSFVSDEIIASRAKVRVRIGNTDAEGRLVLADLLARARELAESTPEPTLFSLATLTGHVYRAYGPYTGVVPNLRARAQAEALQRLGEVWGEPFEISRPRREDYALVAPRSGAEDVVSSNRLASVNTARGHQYPFAFLDVAAGLRRATYPFMHIDIAGTVVEKADWQFGRPTGVPIGALTASLRGEG